MINYNLRPSITEINPAMNNITISEKNKKLMVSPLDRERMLDLLMQYPNDVYQDMNAREYVAERIKIIDFVRLIDVSFGKTSTRALSLLCGWSAGTLYNISSPKATKHKGRYQRPSWEHAARLHIVTHGFIHAKYSCPAFFESAKAIIGVE